MDKEHTNKPIRDANFTDNHATTLYVTSASDTDRIDWLEKQAGHIFDRSSGGGFRHHWRQGDKEGIRETLDRLITQDVDF